MLSTALPPAIEGMLTGAHGRFVIIASRFNDTLVRALVDGATDTLLRHQTPAQQVQVIWVPGAFELPQVAARVARAGGVDAIICLGIVVRGATPHFDFVAGQAAAGIMQAGMAHQVPTVFGVLTCDTLQQALERSGTKAGNKGNEAALAALEMAQLFAQLQAKSP